MRVIVTGGRDYAEKDVVELALDCLRRRCGPLTIIQGGSTGADALARAWAYQQEDVCLVNVPADWQKHKKAAGPIRNNLMLDQCNPQLVVAFPGGKGTDHMVRTARKAGVPTITINGMMHGPLIEERLGYGVEKAKGIASGRDAPQLALDGHA